MPCGVMQFAERMIVLASFMKGCGLPDWERHASIPMP
jgi:hypothetical protein